MGSDDEIVAFHGTSSVRLASILRDGLRAPFVAATAALARYYAQEAADADGGEPVVLSLRLPIAALRYDGAAMDEPVLADEAQRDAAWAAAASGHPDWVEGRTILVPETAWQVSFHGVGSARVEGVIAPGAITRT